MSVQLVGPRGSVESLIRDLVSGAQCVHVQVAFMSQYGASFVAALRERVPVDVTVSLYMRTTTRRALEHLLGALKTVGPHRLRVRLLPGTLAYHGKVVAFERAAGAGELLIGSANWTRKGLTADGDVSVRCAVPYPSSALFPSHVEGAPWSTSEDTRPLESVLKWYQSRSTDHELDEPLHHDGVVYLSDIHPASRKLRKHVADNAKPQVQELAGDDADEPHWVAVRSKHVRQFAIASEVRPDDVVLLGLRHSDAVDVGRVCAVWKGESHIAGQQAVVLFYRELAESKQLSKTQQKLRSQGAVSVTAGGDWPKWFLSRLGRG